MIQSTALAIAIMTIATGSVLIPAHAGPRTKAVASANRCTLHSANGTGVSANIAKFQVFEGLLKSKDTGLWSAWMATGGTPGYAVKNVKYHCVDGAGLGVGCSGRAKVCKL